MQLLDDLRLLFSVSCFAATNIVLFCRAWRSSCNKQHADLQAEDFSVNFSSVWAISVAYDGKPTRTSAESSTLKDHHKR